MNYEETINDLFARHQSVQNAGFSSGAYKPGLEAMRRFDLTLGNPSAKLRCIHVAGTNGKGSVCSMLAAALSSAGYRVGLYTSPHLLDFRERLRILESGRCTMVDRDFVMDFLTRYNQETEGLSFFEITTGMAFTWFARQRVDWAVIETGLGGRLDSTNIITPEISIVTSIGLDHCAILGDTRAAIAAEKAGIFKSGVPALVASRDDETEPVFRAVADSVGANLRFADVTLPLYDKLDMKGPGQRMNLRTALTALEIIGELNGAAAEGICHFGELSCLRGRWEKLCGRPEVICDIGHNPPALAENFRRLEQMRSSGKSRRPLLVVYGVMRDKDLGSILHLFPSDAGYVFCAPDTPRALPAEDLSVAVLAARPELNCRVATGGSVREAVVEAVRQAGKEMSPDVSPIVYVGGSTFVVSEALSIDKELLSCTLEAV